MILSGIAQFNALIAAAPPVIVRVIEPAQHAGIPWPEWITALFTLGLLVVGIMGLRSLRIAARALEVETDPVLIAEEVSPVDLAGKTFDARWDISLDQNGFPTFRDAIKNPYPSVAKTWSGFDATLELRPNTAIRVRNVGRSAAVGLRLLAHIAIAGSSNGLPITFTLIAKNEERYIHLRNFTRAKVHVRFFSIAHHLPEDAKGYLYPRGYIAIRLRLVRIPGFAKTRLYRWLVQRQEQPTKSVYVFSDKTIIIPAPQPQKPTPPKFDLPIEEL